MANGDYGYFGKGDTGYAQYMTAFNRNFGGSSGGGGGGQLRYLAPGQAPKAVFELGSEKPVAVYAYCNLHGLWMTKL